MSTEPQPTSRRAHRRQTPVGPRSASARAYLRNGVPAVYRETWGMPDIDAPQPGHASDDDVLDAFDDEDAEYSRDADLGLPFAMRFLKGLEEVLDPIVTLLDCLPAHMEPKLAPLNVLHTMADWLGLPFEEHIPGEDDPQLSEEERHNSLKKRQRRLVDNALEISRSRGTKRGLKLLLELMFGEPDLSKEGQLFEVIDGGYCVVTDGDYCVLINEGDCVVVSAPHADREGHEPGTFVVRWTRPLDPDAFPPGSGAPPPATEPGPVELAVRHLVEREKPVNVTCKYGEFNPTSEPAPHEATV